MNRETGGWRQGAAAGRAIRASATGERGEAGALGVLVVFLASAVVLTGVMLFVTGVAQKGILPRVKARALRGIPEQTGPEAAVAGVQPETTSVQVMPIPAEPGEVVEVEWSAGQLDSLRALKQQIRVGQEAMDARIAEIRREAARLEEERTIADKAAARRISNLAKIYSSMKPEAAARIMVHLDDETFTLVFNKINSRQAAKIFVFVDPARIARLTRMAATSATEQGSSVDGG